MAISYDSLYFRCRILHKCSCFIEFIKHVWGKIKWEACRAFYHFFSMSLINSLNTGAQMLDSIYQIIQILLHIKDVDMGLITLCYKIFKPLYQWFLDFNTWYFITPMRNFI